MNAIEQAINALNAALSDGGLLPNDIKRQMLKAITALQSMQGDAVLEIRGDEGSKGISLTDIASVVEKYPAGTKLYTQSPAGAKPDMDFSDWMTTELSQNEYVMWRASGYSLSAPHLRLANAAWKASATSILHQIREECESYNEMIPERAIKSLLSASQSGKGREL